MSREFLEKVLQMLNIAEPCVGGEDTVKEFNTFRKEVYDMVNDTPPKDEFLDEFGFDIESEVGLNKLHVDIKGGATWARGVSSGTISIMNTGTGQKLSLLLSKDKLKLLRDKINEGLGKVR